MKILSLASLLSVLLALFSFSAFADIERGDQIRLDFGPHTIGKVIYVSEDLVSLKLDEEASHPTEIVYISANASIFSRKPNRVTLNNVCEGFGFGEGVRPMSSVKKVEDFGKVLDVVTCIRNPRKEEML